MNNIEYKIYCTYHDKKLIDEYQLKETSNFKLFYTKDNLDGYSLNYVQKYLCEWVTQYYVWKNNLKEDIIGFCHYRRNIMNAINNDLLEHVINYSQYKTFMPIPINQLIKNNYSYDFNNCSILLDYKLFGLELHYDLILDYVKENYPSYIVKRTNEVLNSSSVSQNFCELYICKWDVFNNLMVFVDGYIKYLFVKLCNLQKKELYNYTYDEYDQLSFYLNNENYNKRTKFIDELKAQNIVIENIQFAGYPRCLAFIIESIIGLYFNIFMNNNNLNNESYKIDYMIWCTYHDEKLIDEFKLKETDTFKLFYTKKDLPNRYSINHLQQFLCEWVTQYYVWKNYIKTEYVGFCHYHRIINVDENVLKTLKENNIYYHHYFPLRFAKCIKDEWLLGGLNLHVDLIKEYLQTKEKYSKYLDHFDYVMNNQSYMNFGELYICKWDIFEELMEFIEDYIKFLFYKLFNIEYKELYEYSIEEYKQIAIFLNNTNWNLFEQEHIKRGDWDPNNPHPFYGGDRSLAFMIEMVEGLFWELYELALH